MFSFLERNLRSSVGLQVDKVHDPSSLSSVSQSAQALPWRGKSFYPFSVMVERGVNRVVKVPFHLCESWSWGPPYFQVLIRTWSAGKTLGWQLHVPRNGTSHFHLPGWLLHGSHIEVGRFQCQWVEQISKRTPIKYLKWTEIKFELEGC